MKPKFLCCIWCGKPIPGIKKYAQYCSYSCRWEAIGRKRKWLNPIHQDKTLRLDDLKHEDIVDYSIPEMLQKNADCILLKEKLSKIMKFLTPRERKILELRYGLKDGVTRTLEEVGKKFGYTRERIRQLEVIAIDRIRETAIRLNIKF